MTGNPVHDSKGKWRAGGGVKVSMEIETILGQRLKVPNGHFVILTRHDFWLSPGATEQSILCFGSHVYDDLELKDLLSILWTLTNFFDPLKQEPSNCLHVIVISVYLDFLRFHFAFILLCVYKPQSETYLYATLLMNLD